MSKVWWRKKTKRTLSIAYV